MNDQRTGVPTAPCRPGISFSPTAKRGSSGDEALLPGPGKRIAVAGVAIGKKTIEERRKALEKAGMKIEEALFLRNGKKFTFLLWVSPVQ